MAVQAETAGRPAAAGRNWYACTPEDVAAAAGVDPGVGRSAAQAADLLAKNGPNSLPEEKPRPGWRRYTTRLPSVPGTESLIALGQELQRARGFAAVSKHGQLKAKCSAISKSSFGMHCTVEGLT